MTDKISELMREPILNWWGEDDWLNWYRDLQKATKDLEENDPILVHVNTLLPEQLRPHGLHHSRWRMFFDRLGGILHSVGETE